MCRTPIITIVSIGISTSRSNAELLLYSTFHPQIPHMEAFLSNLHEHYSIIYLNIYLFLCRLRYWVEYEKLTDPGPPGGPPGDPTPRLPPSDMPWFLERPPNRKDDPLPARFFRFVQHLEVKEMCVRVLREDTTPILRDGLTFPFRFRSQRRSWVRILLS